ncbi:MAG TPA: SRPBCC family protein [Candidatus Limnocylindrales bacterium]|nr:SRPBCC family protein [Candidatus Limnocylindrales bacterium]
MSRFEESIDLEVPVRVAYDQWTQFEQFPTFMDGVKRVEQLDDTHLRWTASIAGKEETWEADIVDQTPDRRIAWKSTAGAENAGAVLFEPLGADGTRITLSLDAEPRGPVETAGDALGFLRRRVHGDLERFKEQIERHGGDGRGWRGEVHGDEVRPDPTEGQPVGVRPDRS